jgi:hypothetical protein
VNINFNNSPTDSDKVSFETGVGSYHTIWNPITHAKKAL